MKKFSFLCATFWVCLSFLNSTQAQSTSAGEPYRWEKVWSDINVKVMLNKGAIERSASEVRFFLAVSREHPTPEGSRYTLARLEVDCSAKSYRTLRERNSSEIGLQGKELGDLGVFAKERSPMAANEYLRSAFAHICG